MLDYPRVPRLGDIKLGEINSHLREKNNNISCCLQKCINNHFISGLNVIVVQEVARIPLVVEKAFHEDM